MSDTLVDLGKGLLDRGLKLLGSVIPLPGAGGVLRLISSTLGLSDESPEGILSRLDSDPEAVARLQALEKEHERTLASMYLQDIQSARAREVSVVQATGKRDVNLYILAWTMVAGFFGLLTVLFFIEVPEPSRDLINLAVGALLGSFTSVISYFFGSSKGSSDKNQFFMNRGIAPDRNQP